VYGGTAPRIKGACRAVCPCARNRQGVGSAERRGWLPLEFAECAWLGFGRRACGGAVLRTLGRGGIGFGARADAWGCGSGGCERAECLFTLYGFTECLLLHNECSMGVALAVCGTPMYANGWDSGGGARILRTWQAGCWEFRR